ncbi:MAG: hypothetical protein FK733_15890 [Asgard group archaeon]|nr:hypothetical protein [Asgard group archaeon]
MTEQYYSCDKTIADMDNDNLTDGEEIFLGTNPKNNDTDIDDLSDYMEVIVYFTDPLVADTDGDGFDDGVEVEAGTDPLDPEDYPKTGGLGLTSYSIMLILLFTAGLSTLAIRLKRKRK